MSMQWKCLVLMVVQLRLVACSAGGDAWPDEGLARRCKTGYVSDQDIERFEHSLQSRHEISVIGARHDCKNSSVRCQAISTTQRLALYDLLQLVDLELARYPQRFIKQLGPKKIVIASDLATHTHPTGLAGLTLISDEMIYLGLSELCHESVFKRTIHHELFHAFDPKLLPSDHGLGDWSALNKVAFQYGDAHQAEGLSFKAERTGFVSDYATISAAEDKAEVYSWLVVSPWAEQLAKQAATDPILQAKVDYLHNALEIRWPSFPLTTRPITRTASSD